MYQVWADGYIGGRTTYFDHRTTDGERAMQKADAILKAMKYGRLKITLDGQVIFNHFIPQTNGRA